MRAVDIVIGVGWVIFWVGWFAASAGVKRGQGNWARFAGVRVVLILVVVLLVQIGRAHV